MRKTTQRVKQLKTMYSQQNGRIQAGEGWEKFPLFWFLLFLSYQCTRRCSYCYSFNQVGDDNPLEMDEKSFSRLLEWIPDVWKANQVKVNAVGFLGGEPLLRTDRIKKVMDAVYLQTDGMQGFLYTNADLVDRVNWDDLEDIQWISTNITDLEIEELSRRMQVIAQRSNVIGQTIVATLDEQNLERALEISRFGIENGYRLRYYGNFYKGADSVYQMKLLHTYHELCDLFESYILKGFDVHTTFLLDILIPGWNLASSPYPCGRRIAVVFPDGAIGPCIRNHTYKTGTIFDADPLDKLQCSLFHRDIQSTDLAKECGQCEHGAICQGGCSNEKLLLTGKRSGRSVMCRLHKEIIPRLKYLEELKNKGNQADLSSEPVDGFWSKCV